MSNELSVFQVDALISQEVSHPDPGKQLIIFVAAATVIITLIIAVDVIGKHPLT